MALLNVEWKKIVFRKVSERKLNSYSYRNLNVYYLCKIMSIYDKYQVVIGLEVHAQLSTKSKMYCADSAAFGVAPNTNVSPLTLGHPGTLPVVNEEAIISAVKMGLAMNCSIRNENGFARKNYFYADLPKGYQITQDKTPICTDGTLLIKVDGKEKQIGIERIHMEEDAGKSTHDLDPYNTLIDLNRAGVPLIEIVFKPDLRSAEEAYQYLSEVRKLVRYLDICDGNMEEGSMRCDANISVFLKSKEDKFENFGDRCEVKNMNSMRNVMKAIEFEFTRQIDILEAGGTIDQQTRTFNAADGSTSLMRSKENANDYRYFPEPDLPIVFVSDEEIAEIKHSMPKLSRELFNDYVNDLKLSEYDANILSDDRDFAHYFNELIQFTTNYKAATNFMIGPVKSYLNEKAVDINDFPLKPETISKLVKLVEENKVNFNVASSKLFDALLENELEPEALAKSLNLIQESDEGFISEIIDQVLAQNAAKVAEYKGGNKNLLGMFMGQVMKASKGKADPKVASKMMQEKLGS